MKALILLVLLALLALGLCRRGMGRFRERRAPGCGEGTYATSWGGAEGLGERFPEL